MGTGQDILAAPLSAVPFPLPEDAPVAPKRTTSQDVLLVFSVSLMMIVSIMNNMSIVIALPTIDITGINASNLEWPVSAYALAFGCLLLLLGRLADIFGRKRLFLVGAFIFGSFNIACGCAQTLIQLAVFRALTGVGAAAAIPAGAGIIAQTFPPSSRARQIAFTIFSAGAPVGSGLGSTFGGVFTQFSTWRGVFFLTAGLAYVPMVLGWFTIDHDVLDPKRDKRVDWLGGLLSTAGITLLTFGLSAGPTAPDRWATPYVVVSLALGAVLVLAFLAWEHLLVRLDRFTLKPLMPLEIWTRARLGPALGVLALSWAAFNPNLYHTTLFFQKYLELSPIEATVRFLPTAIVGILVNFVFAVLVPYVYGWVLISFGCISGAIAALLMAVIRPEDTYWQWAFPALSLSVFLADFVFATTQLYVASAVEPDEQSLAGALVQVCMQLSVALGLAVTTVVNDSVAAKDALASFGIVANADRSNVPKPSYLLGLRAAQWTSCACGVVAFALAVGLLQPVKILGHRKRTKKERQMADDGRPAASGEKDADIEEGSPASVDTLRADDVAKLEGERARSDKSVERVR